MTKNDNISIEKEIKKTKRNIKRLEKNPLEYKEKDWAIFVGGFIFFGGIVTKLLNIQQWFVQDFILTSYNPWSIVIYVPSSIGFTWYAHYKREPLFLAMGIIGIIYTLMLAFGIIKTYLAIEPII